MPILLVLISAALRADAESIVLGVKTGRVVGGKVSFVSDLQRALNRLPAICHVGSLLVPDGVFGNLTRDAIRAAAACPEIGSHLDPNSAAHQGVLTDEIWMLLMPNRSLPTVHDRAMVIVLTNEATDYDQAEWNFCQSKPKYDPDGGRPACFSNDPRSFLTWGPRGATAGQGKEVQQIVHAIDSEETNKQLIDEAFGTEAKALRRLLKLDESDTERYLCAVWLNPITRSSWIEGFSRFGLMAQVRAVYDTVYASAEFDGGKIERYYRLYAELGLVPSQLDYGFFLDRATQMGAPPESLVARAKTEVRGKSNAEVRRWLAQTFRPLGQRRDRLGRDVVFYADALGPGLTAEEHAAWRWRNPTRASEYGLRDDIPEPRYQARPLAFAPFQPGETQALTATERGRCPKAVLSPLPPRQ